MSTPPTATASDPAPSSATEPSDEPAFGRRALAIGTVDDVRILGPDGRAVASLVPDLPADEHRRIHRAMVLTRKFDVRMLNMQRQGRMGTFAPGMGQEATQIGQVYWLRDSDWYSPSYRSFGAQIWRGWGMDHLMLLWAGFHEGFAPPAGVNDLPFSIVIGSHVPLAVGVGMSMRQAGGDDCVLVNFGDGASSEGAVHEAMNFAGVFDAPVVLVLENNGYAISTRIEQQTRARTFASRGAGYGIPAIRADGNDVLAMLVACRTAVERARAGEGPTLIEAVTYRMGVHTTADDPKVYREDDEVEAWKAFCPIARYEAWLLCEGILDAEAPERIASECEQEVLDARSRFEARAVAEPERIFDFMYESLPPELAEQRREYLDRLRRKGVIGG